MNRHAVPSTGSRISCRGVAGWQARKTDRGGLGVG